MDLSNFTIATGSLLRTKVYLGKLDKKKTHFLSKKDITAEFLSTVVEYVGENDYVDCLDENNKPAFRINVTKLDV